MEITKIKKTQFCSFACCY